MKLNRTAIAALDDLISEADLIRKTGYSTETLRKWRVSGKVKNWYSINSRKIMYSKTELAGILKIV